LIFGCPASLSAAVLDIKIQTTTKPLHQLHL
jgi:hypothetical protein